MVAIPGAAAELEEAASAGEDDEGELGIAEDRELVSLLQQSVTPLCEGHLPVYLVLDPLQLHPPPPHLFSTLSLLLISNLTRKRRQEYLFLEMDIDGCVRSI